MHLFILAAAALLLAALLWYTQAAGATEHASPPAADADQRLHQILEESPRMTEALAEAVRGLEAVMVHPDLGGPGFLLVQFLTAPDVGCAVVSAQYPNIRETLYRRIVRQELERDELAAAGIPEALLSQELSFETESGGIVLLSVRLREIPGEFLELLNSRRERNTALLLLAKTLGPKLPQFSIRMFGTDLLLSPERERIESSAR